MGRCSSACRAGTRLPAAARAAPRPRRAAPAPPGRKIKAHLFYVAEDGTRLASVERDVPYGEGTVEQAREIVERAARAGRRAARVGHPAGHDAARACSSRRRARRTSISAARCRAAHPGGSLDELLTVYTIVDALTVNLPAVTAVQILVDGKEVDTLAGHVDLRRPLAKNLTWVAVD